MLSRPTSQTYSAGAGAEMVSRERNHSLETALVHGAPILA